MVECKEKRVAAETKRTQNCNIFVWISFSVEIQFFLSLNQILLFIEIEDALLFCLEASKY